MILEILQDAFFSAIASVGFAAISRPPHRAYLYCAMIAGAGHSMRFFLMHSGMSLIAATFLASLMIGVLAVLVSPLSKIPAETYLFPSLLPMIPGIYAYKAFAGILECILADGETQFVRSMYLFGTNGLTCGCLLLCMVVGAVLPIFMLKRISFQATR